MTSDQSPISKKAEAWLTGLGCLAGIVVVIALIADSSWGRSHLGHDTLVTIFNAALIMIAAAVAAGLWVLWKLSLKTYLEGLVIALGLAWLIPWLPDLAMVLLIFAAFGKVLTLAKNEKSSDPAQAETDEPSATQSI